MDMVGEEKQTVEAMIRLYCRARHQQELCSSCRQLLEYAVARIDKCRYWPDKPACNHCFTHCYAPKQREEIRQVMRYAGPRMLLYHPRMAISHFLKQIRHDKK